MQHLPRNEMTPASRRQCQKGLPELDPPGVKQTGLRQVGEQRVLERTGASVSSTHTKKSSLSHIQCALAFKAVITDD